MKYNQLNTEKFITKARAIHGDKYDYSKVVYINNYTKVCIICQKHGEFYQRPADHLKGKGCPKCKADKAGNTQKLNTNIFKEKAIKIHKDKYDYINVIYTNTHTKVNIKCQKHGEFYQRPSGHLKGKGCPKCKFEKLLQISKHNKEQFIEKARAIHGDKYDYSKVNYINTYTSIIIICPIHGEFEQIPNYHIHQNGCIKCSQEQLSLKFRSNKEQFVQKAQKVHGDKYDYSKVNYINGKTKITITCPIHGDFEQTPNGHLSGNGCPICKSSKGEKAIASILDKHNISYMREYRIPEVVNELYYDFYLPDYKLLIEFHGDQHYSYVPFFHRNGVCDLEAQKTRDKLVKYNTKKFGYRYLEFNYKQLKHMSTEQFEEMILNSINRFRRINA